VGKYVLAQFPSDEQWYYGKLIKAEGKDFVVRWDEPDENEPESKVSADSMVVLPELAAGDKVKCVWEKDGSWYDGKLVKNNGDNTFVVSYTEDGSEATVGAEKVRKFVPAPSFWMPPFRDGDPAPAVGETVEAWFKDDDEYQGWYSATVKKDAGGGNFEVEWIEDPSVSTVPRNQIRRKAPRIPVQTVARGAKIRGIVRNVQTFGAFVDIGVHDEGWRKDGLVHKRVMSDQYVEDPSSLVSEGDEVDVWFGEWKMNPDKGLQIALSMVEGGASSTSGGGGRPAYQKKDVSSFENIDPQTWLQGTVTGIQPYGLFVEVSPTDGAAAQTGLVPVKNIREGFVEDTQQEAEIGQEVKVRVVNVVASEGKLGLSMLADS
jgi:predicted RNA-binding protein with RPS1 domain